MKSHGALSALLSLAVVSGASSSGALVLVLQPKRPWISLLIAQDTTNCTDNNKETLSLENPRRNTVYSGYCMGCMSWRSSPTSTEQHTIPSSSIIVSDELLEAPIKEEPKEEPITNGFDPELSLPATTPQKIDVITSNTSCEVVQEDETSNDLLDSKPQSVKDDAVACPETYDDEQELLLALLVVSAKVKNDDQYEQNYNESIYIQQILLMILVGVAANASFNNKQSKDGEEDVSNNDIAMKRNLSKQFFKFEVDTEELEEEDDDEDGTPRASDPPTTPIPNPLEQVLKDIFTLNIGDGKNKRLKKDKEKKNKKHKPKRRSTIASCDSTDYIKGEKENAINPQALTDDTKESLITKKVLLQKKKYGRGGKLIQVV